MSGVTLILIGVFVVALLTVVGLWFLVRRDDRDLFGDCAGETREVLPEKLYLPMVDYYPDFDENDFGDDLPETEL